MGRLLMLLHYPLDSVHQNLSSGCSGFERGRIFDAVMRCRDAMESEQYSFALALLLLAEQQLENVIVLVEGGRFCTWDVYDEAVGPEPRTWLDGMKGDVLGILGSVTETLSLS